LEWGEDFLYLTVALLRRSTGGNANLPSESLPSPREEISFPLNRLRIKMVVGVGFLTVA